MNLHFLAGDPCRKFCCQARNLPVVFRKVSLPENSKSTAQQQCSCQQASQQEFFLRIKLSVGKLRDSVRKLLSKEAFQRENFYVCALFRGKLPVQIPLSDSCRIIQILPERSCLMRQSYMHIHTYIHIYIHHETKLHAHT
jgi:hypothetical protein